MNDGSIRLATWNCNAGRSPEGVAFQFNLGALEQKLAMLDVFLVQEVPLIGGKLEGTLEAMLDRCGLVCRAWHQLDAAYNREVGVGAGLLVAARSHLREVKIHPFVNPRLHATVNGDHWESDEKGALTAMVSTRGLDIHVACVHLLPFHSFGYDPATDPATFQWSELESVVGALNSAARIVIVGGDFNRSERTLAGLQGLVSSQTRDSGASHDNIFVGPNLALATIEIVASPSDHHLVEGALTFLN
ncbi:endonuclease/exonuclease/phosphatase family protein [Mycobacterium sp. ITM-2016-00316]|uniref:endonuclease/exonuclease/phosphatase family protein n=1 Tax=Mycobacterium sp. ITM-2016-00316 TaxID=2099695 RepID=UPI001304C670|nr:endonuclease/exonuclease/phosphatase family protein [Mycobacterium sp. ITM-2016-00316]WNG84193.1 endonuclease/exonuclease/phosphatase family protein [Mycobacterium sp. ITM-2016-00316]